MHQRAPFALAVTLSLPLWSCDTRSPAAPDPGPTPTPIAVTPTPAPAPAPTPTPEPTPTPPTGNFNPVTHVTAGVHSYLRNGRLVGTGASSYKPGDVIYLNCTPRDEEGKPVNRHGPIQGWAVWSDDGVTFRATDTTTFNPDVHVSRDTADGRIQAWCKVDGFRSAVHKMKIQR